MRKQILIIITILLVAICFAGAVSAETVEDDLETFNSDLTTLDEPDMVDEPPRDISISGQVLKCSDGAPFSGATVTAYKNGQALARTTSYINGQYLLNFQDNNNLFLITATAPGHNPDTQEVTVISGPDNIYHANTNFMLGMDKVYVDAETGVDETGRGTEENPFKTIQYAISQVNPNGTVKVAPGTYNETLTINKNLNLIGENQETTIIDADGLNNRVITKLSGTVTISNFTIQNGQFTATGDFAFARGGGIFNEFDTLNINDCIIQYNTATATGTGTYSSAFGGAIYNFNGELNIIGSTIQYNTATATGTIASAFGGAIYNQSTLNIKNSTLKYNTATATGTYSSAFGGAIFIDYSSLTANYNRIVGNTAHFGNAIFNEFGSVNVKYNWWGSNLPLFTSLIYGTADYSPWLYMTINADPYSILFGEESFITVSFNNLSDGSEFPDDGHIPDGTPVKFETNLGSIGSKTVNLETEDGIAIATLTADETVGVAQVEAVTDSQTLNKEVNIEPMGTKTITENKNNFPGQEIELKANVEDFNGISVNEGQVQFTVNNTTVGTANVISGIAEYLWTIPADWSPEEYDILAEYLGTNNYQTSTDTAILTVDKTPTNLVVPEQSGMVGETVILSANLTANNQPLFRKLISFYVEDRYVGFSFTEANGVANLDYLLTKAGQFNLKAKFFGTAQYRASENTNKLNVDKITTQIAVPEQSGVVGETVILSATLTANNQALSGKEIIFYVDEKVIGTGNTGEDGVSKIDYRLKEIGEFIIKAEYKGDSQYLASDDSATLNVSSDLVITKFNPDNGEMNIPGDKIITVTFNQDVFEGDPLPGIRLRDSDRLVDIPIFFTGWGTDQLTLTPQDLLLPGTRYRIIIHTGSVVNDLGDSVALTDSFFYSEGTIPQVERVVPLKDSIGVPVDALIRVFFDQRIQFGDTIDGLPGNVRLRIPGIRDVPITTEIIGNVLRINPVDGLEPGTNYQIIIHTGGILGLSGDPVSLFTSDFRTRYTLPAPKVETIIPANGAVNVPVTTNIQINFPENIIFGNPVPGIRLRIPGAVDDVPITTNIVGNLLTITPNITLDADTKYSVILHTDSVRSIEGRPIELFTSQFTTVA